MADTERLELPDGQWAEITKELNNKAYTLGTDALGDSLRVKSDTFKAMMLCSITRWSFGDKVDLHTLDYELKPRHYIELLERITSMFLAVGGDSEDDDEKKS
jgi:hypothetical protein